MIYLLKPLVFICLAFLDLFHYSIDICCSPLITRYSGLIDLKKFLISRSQLDGGGRGDPEDCVRGRRLKTFLADYKTWGYMACVGLVVIGAIVIIILAAMGVISTSRES
jgi:hypothetical protein